MHRQEFLIALLVLATLVALVQAALGTDPVFCAIAFLALLFFGLPVLVFGFQDIGALFCSLLLSKYSFFPFVLKTSMGERLDVGLASAENTYWILLAGSMVACLALFLARLPRIRRPLFNQAFNVRDIARLGVVSSLTGLAALVLHLAFAPRLQDNGEMSAGFGGFGDLAGLVYFGVICLTVVSSAGRSRTVYRVGIYALLGTVLMISLVANAKAYFTLAVLAYLMAYFFFSVRTRLRYLFYLILFAVAYVVVFAPLVHVLRTYEFREADFTSRIAMIEDALENRDFDKEGDLDRAVSTEEYYPSLAGPLMDRLEMIADLDVVVAGVDESNALDWLPVTMAFKSIVPSALMPDKPTVSDIDVIAYRIGLSWRLQPLKRTLGQFATSYAMFLWPAWVLMALLLLFAYFLVLRLLFPSSAVGNVVGVYFLAKYSFLFSEQGTQAIIQTLFRAFPVDVLLLLLLIRFGVGRPVRHG